MTTTQQSINLASQELNWKAVYSYFLPEIVEIYKRRYVELRNKPHFYVPASQQPYELNTSRYDTDFWTGVLNEHWHHGVSFDETWHVFMTLNGCGAMPWPDMMRRAPKVFSEMGLYGQTSSGLLGEFSLRTSDAAIQQVITEVEEGWHDKYTACLAFMMSSGKWERLTDTELRFHIAHYLEQFLSIKAAQELESKLGARVKPFFDWIATGLFRDPQP